MLEGTTPELPYLIIGGGASGVCLAAWLTAYGAKRVDVVEPSEMLGLGVAYSSNNKQHLLNVTPDRMDANPVDGYRGFCDWLRKETGKCDVKNYYPRQLYGEYLQSFVETIGQRTDLVHHRKKAVSFHRVTDGFAVTFDDGGVVATKNVIIAVGNLNPRPIAPDVNDVRIVEDPWATDFSELSGVKKVVVAGAGLTAIDVLVSLLEVAPNAEVDFCAAHPFTPPADVPTGPWQGAAGVPEESPSWTWHWCLEKLRENASPEWWISVMEGLKGQSNRIWGQWSASQRSSFVRHGLRLWLHHRHRTPPPSFTLLQRLLASGKVKIKHGRVGGISPNEQGVMVSVGSHRLRADAVINATGPSVNPEDSQVLKEAVKNGYLVRDAVGLGFAVDADGQAQSVDGRSIPGVWVLGSWTRGSHFEVVPVPVIRKRAAGMAKRLVAIR